MATNLCSKTFSGQTTKVASARAQRSTVVRAPVVVRAQQDGEEVSRRAALTAMVGAAALLAGPVAPSKAAYGDAANVFGRRTNASGFVPFAGDGYALNVPSKWNPSPQREFPNMDLRYEDNFDAVNNLVVIVEKSGKASIEDYGEPTKFLEQVNYLLGKQAFGGETQSEGGFAPNRVVAASLLDYKTVSDKKGRKYYTYEVLTRTADGDEGGRHRLIKAGVSNGNLYLLMVTVGDKRWFKGTKKEADGIFDSFTIA